MGTYTGPERRAIITFTREDSDRLVRVEQQTKTVVEQLAAIDQKLESQNNRIRNLEHSQSWLWGLGSAFVFIATTVVIFLKTHLSL